MTYTAKEGREQILQALATATEQIGLALGDLGEAHELLDERAGERLEEELFMPAQRAYSRARRTHSEFAQRSGLPTRTFEQPSRGAPSRGAKGFIEAAAEAVTAADEGIAQLQDSMLPVEAGDAELRAGLSEVRELLSAFGRSARQLLRGLGR